MKTVSPIALVTGAAGGIGRVIAQQFAEQGHQVIATDITPAEFTHPNIHFRQADITTYEEVCALFSFAREEFGGLHILVNNAALSTFSKSISTITPDEFKKVIDTNLHGAFACCKQFIEANRGLPFGRIINIASTRWHQNEANWEAYGASKGALVSLTNTLCVSLSNTPITVNAISPGWIECNDYASLTEQDHRQHPSGRVGRPEDIARMVLFLSDPANDFINGANIVIDGGMTKRMIYVE